MKATVSLIVLFLAVCLAGKSHAYYSTTVTYDYGSTSGHIPTSTGGGSLGINYLTIVKPDASGFSDTFSVAGLSTVTAASISVTHNGNFDTVLPNGYGEQWQVMLDNTIPVGVLSNSFYDWTTGTLITGWQTDSFTLSNAALNAINNSSPSHQFTISFVDGTLGANSFTVKNASVSAQGAPSPVPLPAALSLFAPGLFGVAAFRRRRLS